MRFFPMVKKEDMITLKQKEMAIPSMTDIFHLIYGTEKL